MTIYDFEVKRLNGTTESLSKYKGKVLLIVNTASACGFTNQYEGLEALYKKYKDKGLEVLGFPCNQFGEQEKGDSKEIAEFCSGRFGVTFPLFEKIEVNGPQAAPLYEYLKKESRGILGTKAIKWNFTKFLVDKSGRPVDRFAPQVKPEEIDEKIKQHL